MKVVDIVNTRCTVMIIPGVCVCVCQVYQNVGDI